MESGIRFQGASEPRLSVPGLEFLQEDPERPLSNTVELKSKL